MADNETNIIFRIDRDLKTEFEAIAKASERTISQYLRAFIKDQVAKHRQQAHRIAPESINGQSSIPTTSAAMKTQQKPKKGQKLNTIPRRKAK